MNIDEGFYLVAFCTNGDDVRFKSSSSSVASVNKYGYVTAKKAGKAKITAYTGNAESCCDITVRPTVITLSDTTLKLEANRQRKITAKTSTGAAVVWSSSKKSVATIDDNGVVTTIKPGETTIKAKCQGTEKECRLTVKSPTISLSQSSATLYRNDIILLKATVSSGKFVKWKSSKSSVATVTDAGYVRAQKHGSCEVSATVDKVTKKCKITVKQPTIKLDKTELDLKVGKRATITATVSSGNKPEWTTSNDDVAIVNSEGVVEAIGVGKAKITCSEDGVKKICRVTVVEK